MTTKSLDDIIYRVTGIEDFFGLPLPPLPLALFDLLCTLGIFLGMPTAIILALLY